MGRGMDTLAGRVGAGHGFRLITAIVGLGRQAAHCPRMRLSLAKATEKSRRVVQGKLSLLTVVLPSDGSYDSRRSLTPG